MGSTEKFCLRWNDFESNISGSFKELRNENEFFDVTLAAIDEDGKEAFVQAHKVILAACSPFFRRLLSRLQHATTMPLLYLRGVQHSDLLSILNFMYHGEVNISQDDLNSFLSVAEELAVKGLTSKDKIASSSSSSSTAAVPSKKRTNSAIPNSQPKRKRIISAQDVKVKAEMSEDIILNTEYNEEDNSHLLPEDDDDTGTVGGERHVGEFEYFETSGGGDGGGVIGDYSADDPGLEESMGPSTSVSEMGTGSKDIKKLERFFTRNLETGKCFCKMCNYSTVLVGNVRRHIEAKHYTEDDIDDLIIGATDGFYICSVCGRRSKKRRDIARHVEAIHTRNSYDCPYCDRVIVARRNLQRHIRKYHRDK